MGERICVEGGQRGKNAKRKRRRGGGRPILRTHWENK